MQQALAPSAKASLTDSTACEREEVAFMAVADVARCSVPCASAAGHLNSVRDWAPRQPGNPVNTCRAHRPCHPVYLILQQDI